MTTLASHSPDDDLLGLLDEVEHGRGLHDDKLAEKFKADFRECCRLEALEWGGWVNPNFVRMRMCDLYPEMSDRKHRLNRSYSAQWVGACGPHGFLNKTEHPVPIDRRRSVGNGNKSVYWRRWRSQSTRPAGGEATASG